MDLLPQPALSNT